MKIRPNGSEIKVDSAPYNNIYTAFEPFFLDLLESRRGTEFLNANLYVSMPAAEKQLESYIASGASCFCFLIGNIGIGKSSLVSHMKNSLAESVDNDVIYLDLNSRDVAFNTEELTQSDETPIKQKVHFLVYKLMSNFILAHIRDRDNPSRLDLEALPLDLIDFIKTTNDECLQDISLFEEDQNPSTLLKRLKEKSLSAFARLCFKFYANRTAKKRFVIIVDNGDMKDSHIIEAFIEFLASLRDCLLKLNMSRNTENAIVIKPIIACRPHTFYEIERKPDQNHIGTHGKHEVRIAQPCSIA